MEETGENHVFHIHFFLTLIPSASSKCVVSWLFYVQRQKKMNAYSGEQVKRYLKYIFMRVSRNYHARV